MSVLEMLQNFGIIGLAIVAITWLAREIFNRMLSRDLEKFKADLEKQAVEFRIRYERLHSERVGVIKEVYKKIVSTYRSFHSLMNPLQLVGEPTQEEKGREAAKNANELINYYEENRIFFEEKLAEDVDSLLSGFRDAWNKFNYSIEARKVGEHKEALKEWNLAWNQIQKKVPDVKKQLENKFRNILGIKDEN